MKYYHYGKKEDLPSKKKTLVSRDKKNYADAVQETRVCVFRREAG